MQQFVLLLRFTSEALNLCLNLYTVFASKSFPNLYFFFFFFSCKSLWINLNIIDGKKAK